MKMFKSKRLISCLVASLLLTVGGVSVKNYTHSSFHVSAARVPQRDYQIQSANYHRLRVVKRDAPLWQQPKNPDVRQVGNVNHLAHTNRLVHLNKQAIYHGKAQYYQIGRVGHTLGWLRSNDLARPREYVLPYRYVSQFWPSHADDACEAAALMMALSVKGKGLHTPLHKVVERIPRSRNPEKGYRHNPFRYHSGATIYPRALAEVSQRQFHIRAKSITGASKHQLISDIEHGNPVVFEGSFRMQDTQSDHTLALLGYKPGYFYYADPLSKRRGVEYTGWVSTRRFMKIFTARKRGARAVLVY